MGSLLAEGNKKDRADQYKLVAKMRFYGFREVKFLFKTFMHAYSKHSLSYLRRTHSCWMLGKK
ncbi:hypothetical protein BGL55_03070 [Helicobacter pylori]|uniref:Uncharacterized protein n=1 Tax=Helicobacter pylori TaxID=210 RepID=A0A083YD52_HELPX|nr:hypothetical protein [Helicobacter pylori]KEY38731.1 hypothetical protein GZ76_07385 [Helicobacter pylori]OPG30845.1 hypothetical protein BGL55_03070 [Helicobacter pylori]OPG37127.1 hypothetical protein BGL74_06460 [Helicobacter pylori]PDW44091.1 hypothetical protein BB429_07525 [Helicobacter pylori]PDW48466.1 hypothetical protein BB434_07435 [Helicobacter pylori]